MSLLELAPDVDATAPVARSSPVAKLAVATAVGLVLLLTVDVVTPSVALVLEVLALPWCGVGPRGLLRRGWLVLLGALPAGVATAVVGPDSGAVLSALGPLTVTTGSLTSGAAISARILAIGLPGVVLLATTDPTDLADSLSQVLRLPHRFTLAALASLRLFGVLAEEWRSLVLARRARGLGGGGPVAAVRTLGGTAFALLVLAVRRASTLATTMEARGFGHDGPRTWARPAGFTAYDVVVVLAGFLLAATAATASVLAGTWSFVLT